MNLIALGIPAFFALILLELWVTRRRGLRVYRLGDTLANMACGTGQQVAVAMTAAGLWIYDGLHQRFGVFALDASSPWAWAAVLLLVDFHYYWWHRAAHRVGFLWTTHAVHHQSEDYNLSVALRQSWTQRAMAWPFYFPLAVVGFPVGMFVTAYSINVLYQFWIHTPLVGRLGPLELVLNTPSHHRVHHGADREYLDRNHGGVLIVWDRLFGTFAQERATPRYGTVEPLRRFDAVVANLQPLRKAWRLSVATPRLLDAIRVWLAPPEWRPPGAPAEAKALRTDGDYTKYDPALTRADARWAVLLFVVTLAGALAFLALAPTLSVPMRIAWGVIIVAALALLGTVLDRRGRER